MLCLNSLPAIGDTVFRPVEEKTKFGRQLYCQEIALRWVLHHEEFVLKTDGV